MSFLSWRLTHKATHPKRTNSPMRVPYTAALVGSNLEKTLLKLILFGGTKNVVANVFPGGLGHLHMVSFNVDSSSTCNI